MYKITFDMTSPIAMIDKPVFDGLLLYAVMREKYGNIAVDLTPDDLNAIPVKWHEDGFPLSSVMFFDDSTESTGSWKKRWDGKNDHLADFGKLIRKIKVSGEKFKSYDMPLCLVDVRQAFFYFESDDVQRVQYLLLNHLAGIGKKVSQGYGFYSKFKIEESGKSFETEVLRPRKLGLPSTNRIIMHGGAFPIRYATWRPSYWNQENYTQCIYP
jgi:hypothetical protein